jgi:signal transduction protein with GAF and PtsI domain
MTAGQATYDLRRLRTHGLIQRIPHTNRYLPTEDGLRAAIVLTQTHARLLTPALASATDPSAEFPRLHRAVQNVRAALDDYAHRHGLAA